MIYRKTIDMKHSIEARVDTQKCERVEVELRLVKHENDTVIPDNVMNQQSCSEAGTSWLYPC